MINRVNLMGRLVADPELRTTKSGIAVTSIRIAVDRNYVKEGEERRADFFTVIVWRRTAEFVCRNFVKGSMIAVDGKLQSRPYVTSDGHKGTAIEIVAEEVSFTGEKKKIPENLPEIPPPAEDFSEMPLDDDLPF